MAISFTSENWQHMDNSARIMFCQAMARTAMNLAKTSPFNVSEIFLQLAEGWGLLGSEITRAALQPPGHIPESLSV